MPTNDTITKRVESLIQNASDYDKLMFADAAEVVWSGWLASANAVTASIVPDADAPHRLALREIADSYGAAGHKMARAAMVLQYLLNDLHAGLFTKVEDQASAKVFDDFLDHGLAYLSAGRKNEAAVIAGVVFEDAMRRARAKYGVTPDDVAMEDLIAALRKLGKLTDNESRRARAASGLRTSATHARWDEFSPEDVKAAAAFTREFIGKHFDS